MNRVLVLLLAHSIASAQPVSDFMVSRTKVCSGSSISLINASVGAHSYEWLIDNLHFSFAADTHAVMYEPCYDMKKITLIACDSATALCDTSHRFIEVFDSCFFHWTADILKCAGDTVSLVAHPEATDTYWDIPGAHATVGGCDTCSSFSFVLLANGITVDLHTTYDGGCSEITSYHYLCLTPVREYDFPGASIFPIPSGGRIHFSGFPGYVSLQIFDQTGKFYASYGSLPELIDLPGGIYLFRLSDGIRNMNARVIVLHN
jgi:hypothetical protein